MNLLRCFSAWLFGAVDWAAVKRAKQRSRAFEKNWRKTAHMADIRDDRPPIVDLDV